MFRILSKKYLPNLGYLVPELHTVLFTINLELKSTMPFGIRFSSQKDGLVYCLREVFYAFLINGYPWACYQLAYYAILEIGCPIIKESGIDLIIARIPEIFNQKRRVLCTKQYDNLQRWQANPDWHSFIGMYDLAKVVRATQVEPNLWRVCEYDMDPLYGLLKFGKYFEIIVETFKLPNVVLWEGSVFEHLTLIKETVSNGLQTAYNWKEKCWLKFRLAIFRQLLQNCSDFYVRPWCSSGLQQTTPCQIADDLISKRNTSVLYDMLVEEMRMFSSSPFHIIMGLKVFLQQGGFVPVLCMETIMDMNGRFKEVSYVTVLPNSVWGKLHNPILAVGQNPSERRPLVYMHTDIPPRPILTDAVLKGLLFSERIEKI